MNNLSLRLPCLTLRSLLLTTLLWPVFSSAQPPDRIDPKSPFWIWLPQTGTMQGDSTMSGFGSEIHAVGDADHSGADDFLVHYARVDTSFDHFGSQRYPAEYRLYKGVPGGLPRTEGGQRIGLSEIGGETIFLGSGDFDNDGNIDLCITVRPYGDTSRGNVDGYTTSTLHVLWGTPDGIYSEANSTELFCTTENWMSICDGVTGDITNDGIDDLLIHACSGKGFNRADDIRAIPKVHVFAGRDHGRWNDENSRPEADWLWWEPPPGSISLLDQDADGRKELMFQHYITGPTTLRMLYERDGQGYPDTAEIMMVDLAPANGQGVAIGDITGDNVAELLMSTGSENMIRVYAGRRGQRLDEQFGSGFEGPHPERGEWWYRPWAEVWMAPKLNDGFFGSNCVVVLGDVNLDGVNDIMSCEDPWYIFYVAGDRLDSLIDAFVRGPSKVRGVWNLGDIDSSSTPTFAVYYWEGVLFYKATTEVSSAGKFRRLPHLPSSVGEESHETSSLVVQAVPNPASGEVRIVWRGGEAQKRRSGDAVIHITDVLGQAVLTMNVAAYADEAAWNASGVVGGYYFITVTVGEVSETTRVLIQP